MNKLCRLLRENAPWWHIIIESINILHFKQFSLIHSQKFILPCELSPTVCCRLRLTGIDAVNGVSAVLWSERLGMYMEDNFNCPMSRLIVRSCPRWMWTACLIHLVNLLLSLERILLFFHSMVYPIYGESTPVRRSLQQTVGESSQGKLNFWLCINENRFK